MIQFTTKSGSIYQLDCSNSTSLYSSSYRKIGEEWKKGSWFSLPKIGERFIIWMSDVDGRYLQTTTVVSVIVTNEQKTV